MMQKKKEGTDKISQDGRPVFWKQMVKGLVISNPVFMLALGLCPALAVTNSLDNALGMGAGVIMVLLCSNIIISAIRKAVPPRVRIPAFIIIIATFVTILSLVFEAYLPSIRGSLGIYLPLIAVNCMILGRAEIFASRHSVGHSIADAISIGLGFTIALVFTALFREVLGTGALSVFGFSLFSIPVLFEHPMMFFISPPGAFLVVGLLIALFRWIGVKKDG